ncbi:MAG: MATE family efflux transporter [Pseudomonadota bacterium]
MTANDEVTHRRVLQIALPIVLSNATVPILGAVDTGVVGQLGEAAPIGAVGIGAVILATLYWVFGFLRMGTTGLAAQARGAGNMAETGALLIRGLLLAAVAGAVLILLQGGVFWAAFAIAPTSAEVEDLAQSYLSIRIWGAPATIGLYAITGWLIAARRTRGVFVLQLVMNSLNIGLDLWFVLGLGWGVQGVAIATLIAELSGLSLGLWLCRDAFANGQWRDWPRVFDPVRLRRMMVVNADIMVRSVLLTASFTTFLFIGADFGDVTLAANQILVQFLEITAFALDGFAFSAEALVGGAVGAGRRKQVRRAAILSSQWGIAGAFALALFYLLLGPVLIDLMTTAPDVRIEARTYLFWAIISPLIAVASYMLDGVFIGGTWTRDMRWAMIHSVAIYVAALFALVPFFGNHGLWAALMILNVARAITLGMRYWRLESAVGR